jgi:hypothetical protein
VRELMEGERGLVVRDRRATIAANRGTGASRALLPASWSLGRSALAIQFAFASFQFLNQLAEFCGAPVVLQSHCLPQPITKVFQGTLFIRRCEGS